MAGREGACFFVSFSKWWEGVLTSPKSHTLQKYTTPSSWRQREKAQKRNGWETEDTTKETKRKATQALDTEEKHARK